ncbi:MAG: hypothetical protein WAN75_14745 [Xanthobacteraceae bacterium]
MTDAPELTQAIVAAGRESGIALIVFRDLFIAVHHEESIAEVAQPQAARFSPTVISLQGAA